MFFITSFFLIYLFFVLKNLLYKARCNSIFCIKKGTREITCDMVLELLLVCIKNGASIQKSFIELSKLSDELLFLKAISKKLLYGQPWNEAWKNAPKKFYTVKNCIELSWNKGVSPIISIENQLRKNYEVRKIELKRKSEKLSIKIVIPLGLCFLPSFIFLSLIPIIIFLFNGINF